MSARGRKLTTFAVAIGVLFIGLAWLFGPVLSVAYRHGFLDSHNGRTYTASQMGNLKALHTALMLYEESEGQFPDGNGWMDAIQNRIQTADMATSEADKKLKDPSVTGTGYGWAFNSFASGKYKGDLKDPDKLPLLFSSSDLARNACGDPKKLLPKPPRAGGNIGISVAGQILHL